jgi:hypothetical protein
MVGGKSRGADELDEVDTAGFRRRPRAPVQDADLAIEHGAPAGVLSRQHFQKSRWRPRIEDTTLIDSTRPGRAVR